MTWTRIEPQRLLVGGVDPEERFVRFPARYMMKGMFFSRMIDLGGERTVKEVQDRLKAPPALGRYLPFADYPQVDFSRVSHAVAARRFPNVAIVEAMRRLAREDIRTFAASSIGSVMFALIGGDPVTALLKLPDMYGAALKGGRVLATKLDDERVELEFVDFYGWVDCYPIGHIEGLAALCSRRCEIELSQESEVHARMRVALLASA